MHWLPLLIWATLILFFSTRPQLPPVVASSTGVGITWGDVIHVFEYAGLAFWAYRAFRHQSTQTLLFCLSFAFMDESLQRFVPGRAFELWDLGLDASGVLLMLTLYR